MLVIHIFQRVQQGALLVVNFWEEFLLDGTWLGNISGQWVRMDASNMLKENTFRINVGITFNERWFMKWKVE